MYFGCTSRSLHERIAEHRYRALRLNKNLKFDNAIRKYGFENFNWKIIETLSTHDEMLALEQQLISEHGTFKDGYNSSLGGESGSFGLGGDKHWSYGVLRTDAEKQHLSNVMKGRYCGENNPFYGLNHSDETKLKISLANKGNKPHTTKYWKVVLPSGETIETSDRVKFCKEHNLNYNSVRSAVSKGRPYKNYKFKQLGD